MLKYVCLALFIALSSASPFKDCGNGEVKSVEVKDCTETPWIWGVKGKIVTFNMTIAPNTDSKSPKIEMISKLGLVKFPISMVNNDACQFMKCPVKKGETVVLSSVATLPAIGSNELTVKLIDGSKTLACSTFSFHCSSNLV